MSQKRLFEFEAQDSTFDINSRFATFAEIGVHAGFDVVLDGSMLLKFNHNTTGRVYVNSDLSLTEKQGVIITRQGTEIRQGTVPNIPILPTTIAARKDAIICTHSYQFVTGGVAAIFSTIENIGDSEPVLQPNQTLLGILTLPLNCNALNQSGVSYERRNVVSIKDLNDKSIDLQEQIDTLSASNNAKIPLSQKGATNGVATLDASTKIPIGQLPQEFNSIVQVNNVTERNALPTWSGRMVHVIDASGDSTVGSGFAGYRWNGSAWIKIYEQESLDKDPTPIGSIIMIDNVSSFNLTTGLGSGAWTNWALCDGQNGTPNLKGRFIVGFDNSAVPDPDYNNIGETGGEKQVTLSTNQIPAHEHVLAWAGNVGGNELSGSENLATTYDANGEFKSTLGGTNNTPNVGKTGSSGSGQAHENRPPYYVLAYVKKIA